MDKLQERAIAFKRLLNYKYIIQLGKKDKLYSLIIDFKEEDFCHLIGLHKLKDFQVFKRSATKAFYKCLNGKVKYADISQSFHFSELGSRFEKFDNLEQLLDNNEIVFKLNTNEMKKYSNIKADYILKCLDNESIFYIFVEKRASNNDSFCKSFFENNKTDYTRGQTSMTLLYKEKINKSTGESIIQYDKLTKK